MNNAQWIIVLLLLAGAFILGITMSSGGGLVSLGEGASVDLNPSVAELGGNIEQARLTQNSLIIKGKYMGLNYGTSTGTIIYVTSPNGDRVAAEQDPESSMTHDEGIYIAELDSTPSGTYIIEVTRYSTSNLNRSVERTYKVKLSTKSTCLGC